MVIWITGLSGAGKTTLAEATSTLVRSHGTHVAMVDGDVIRQVFGGDLGHTILDRRANAERIMRLCQWLDGQGIHVLCAILSLFPEHREWMRENVSNFYEVFIDVPLRDLRARDSKGLYRAFENGEIREVAGLDIPFLAPQYPDLRIENVGKRDQLLSFARQLADRIIEA